MLFAIRGVFSVQSHIIELATKQRWIDFIAINWWLRNEKATCSVAIWHTRSVVWQMCQADIASVWTQTMIFSISLSYFNHSFTFEFFFSSSQRTEFFWRAFNLEIDWMIDDRFCNRTNKYKFVLDFGVRKRRKRNWIFEQVSWWHVTLRQFIHREKAIDACIFGKCFIPFWCTNFTYWCCKGVTHIWHASKISNFLKKGKKESCAHKKYVSN